MPIKIAFPGPLSLPCEALLFSYLLWAEKDSEKKGSGKGMKCPEGWRGEEKQEQAPCVEIQAGEREERESGVQAGMAKMQRGSAVQGTGRETPTKKRPSRENKKIQEVSLRQAMLIEQDSHLPMSRAQEAMEGECARHILLSALLCSSPSCLICQLKAIFCFPQAIVIPDIVASLPD